MSTPNSVDACPSLRARRSSPWCALPTTLMVGRSRWLTLWSQRPVTSSSTRCLRPVGSTS